MDKKIHDMLVGALVLIAVLMAVTTNYWLPYVKHLNYLFKDNLAIGLIATVVVLLTLYDCKLGIAFAFVVGIVAINMQGDGFEAFADLRSSRRPETTRYHRKPEVTKREGDKRVSKVTEPTTKSMENEDDVATFEDIRSSRRPMPTMNVESLAAKRILARSSLNDKEGFQNMTETNVIADKIEKQMQVPAPATCNAKDFNTYSTGKDYHGFDVAGCRYDLESKTQNSTLYGPPLSWCATYKDCKLPVPFYPLNG